LHRADTCELGEAPPDVLDRFTMLVSLVSAEEDRFRRRHRSCQPLEPPVIHSRSERQRESREPDEGARDDRDPAECLRAPTARLPNARTHRECDTDDCRDHAERHHHGRAGRQIPDPGRPETTQADHDAERPADHQATAGRTRERGGGRRGHDQIREDQEYPGEPDRARHDDAE